MLLGAIVGLSAAKESRNPELMTLMAASPTLSRLLSMNSASFGDDKSTMCSSIGMQFFLFFV